MPSTKASRLTRTLVTTAVAAAAAGSLATGATAPASAFDGPNGHTQFARISASTGTIWSASMTLYRRDGSEVYHWESGNKSGGGVTWWYTQGDGYLKVRIGNFLIPTWKHGDFDIPAGGSSNNCFRNYYVNFSYKTDITTGDGCTPD
ncbi:hypothetical protein [Williamsia sp. CHRR-6]|uniref:hypothetical protein n=1 Tax=Williamsia sp. CHRR-6 TaxID=2835871 RepID=UPI001BDAE965|nr:hypothetical protein [Williamsia sp. CHRR-6]MBT0567360.1 hypothetical protein [Williamsia sp. CHRR-6]